MDAQVRSEEKFSKLSIAYKGKQEEDLVNSVVDSIVSKYKIKPEMYVTSISNGRNVLVIEYEDDEDRVAGDIFEKIIKTLDIEVLED